MKLNHIILLSAAALICIASSAQEPTTGKAHDLGWLELPEFVDDNNHFFVNHYTDEYWGRQRNYSLYWDVDKQLALWVAYPLNRKLLGRGSRTAAWHYDSFVSTKKQPCLRRTYQAGNVEGYIRGHLCPSSDRLSPEMNQQTFFYTNIAPMDPYFNDGIWAALENKVQHLAIDADNGWIVTGCIDSDTTNFVKDVNGKRIAVPEKFWKAVLVLDADSRFDTDGYRAEAWILENRNYGFSGFDEKLEVVKVSVDSLESLTGLDLFVNLPIAVGAEKAETIEK